MQKWMKDLLLAQKGKVDMPTPLTLPFPPLSFLTVEGLLSPSELESHVSRRIADGISICIRHSVGVNQRGGYFFHFRSDNDSIGLYNFESHKLHAFKNYACATEFINHVIGLAYSQPMWSLAQTLNLRTDDQTL